MWDRTPIAPRSLVGGGPPKHLPCLYFACVGDSLPCEVFLLGLSRVLWVSGSGREGLGHLWKEPCVVCLPLSSQRRGSARHSNALESTFRDQRSVELGVITTDAEKTFHERPMHASSDVRFPVCLAKSCAAIGT